jgi:hypothetical protein
VLVFISSQCFAVNKIQIIDFFDLTGVGGPLNPLNTNAGGGNQHQQSSSPIFSFGDMPMVIFQRSQMNPNGNSSLWICKGLVTQNQDPPPSSVLLEPSTAAGSLSTIPDYVIDYATYNVAGSPGQQVWNFMSADPTANYTIAVVEITPKGNGGSNQKTLASFQFNFGNLRNVNGVPTPIFDITTQLGSTGQ